MPTTTPESPSRILIVAADECRFRRLRSLCLTAGRRPQAVHWLGDYVAARETLLQEAYDVVVLDIRHHGFRLLCDLASVGSDTPVVMLVDEPPPSRNAAGVICEFLPRDELNAGRLDAALREVVRRVGANRATLARHDMRSQAWWRCGGLTSSHTFAPERDQFDVSLTALTGSSREESVAVFPPRPATAVAADSHGLLNEMLEHLPLIAAQIDEDGTILDCGGNGLKPLHLTRSALRGRNVFQYPEFPAAAVKQAMRGTPVMTVCTWTVDGRARHFECHFRFDASRQRGAIGFAHDVTDRVEADRARAGREQMLAGVLEHLPAIVGRLDARGYIREIGGTGRLAPALAHHNLDGARFADVFPDADRVVTAALAGQPGHFETSGNSGTSQELHVEFHLARDHQNPGGAVFFGQDVTRHRRLEHELLHAVDAERQRLGADLHDEVGQLLTGITCLSTALVERLRGANDLAAEEATTITEVAREALAQTRALARGLAPVRLAQHGLVDALENLRTHVQRMHEVDVRLHLPEMPATLDIERTAHVFRIAQEAITNAVRHGQATIIEVTLEQGDGSHRLIISDNGRGFDPQRPRQSAGSGLGLMEYRAALIGGRLHLSSGPATGTCIEVCFPPTQNHPHETAC